MNIEDLKAMLERLNKEYKAAPGDITKFFDMAGLRSQPVMAHPATVRSWRFEAPRVETPQRVTLHETLIGGDLTDAMLYGMKVVISPMVPPDTVYVMDAEQQRRISDRIAEEMSRTTYDLYMYGRFGGKPNGFAISEPTPYQLPMSLGEHFERGAAAGRALAREMATSRKRRPRRFARRAHAKRIAKRRSR